MFKDCINLQCEVVVICAESVLGLGEAENDIFKAVYVLFMGVVISHGEG